MEHSMPVDQGTRNLVSEETQNTSHQCQEVEKCHHPPFPKPSPQILLLTTSRDLPPYLPLFVGMYAATPLLNLTCRNFYRCKLRPQQEVAQREFVQLVLNALAVSKAWYDLDPEELEAFEKSRYSRTEVESLALQLEGSLHEMMVRLDDFFFFGALTRYPHNPTDTNVPRYSHVELLTGFGDLKGKGEGNSLADSTPVFEVGRWFAKIRLFPKTTVNKNLISKVERISFEEIVASLIHEMQIDPDAEFVDDEDDGDYDDDEEYENDGDDDMSDL
ncbi:uncharacterized protein BDZ83DRAFT_773087 [Colletotrichum acutatum]|uniref:Uncharacterized protein n=1 Tax=Glomerella acutata TaxID=27357 RepID=A0AAD8UT69_GLOAC|nr:uncharacterized protein BDZ83DRAFT_773087 [Colletotrichum acutatum]KAK1726881.1 hypothetical protein BDZ83DRAFT_773087 [Colletotrichum acutatum]